MPSSLSPPPASLQNRSSRLAYRDDSRDRNGTSISPSPYRSSIRSSSRGTSRAPLFRRHRDSVSPYKGSNGRSEPKKRSRWDRYKFSKDHRKDLPPFLRRFTGYKDPNHKGPTHPPIYGLGWLTRIPLKYETWIIGWIGAVVAIILIEAVMSSSALFQDYQVPLIIGSYGASAVLSFGMPDAPVSQPRNLFFGQIFGALTSIIITRLFSLRPGFTIPSNAVPPGYDAEFSHHLTWLNGALAMATSLTIMQITGTLHPPSGATALLGATSPQVIQLSWKYLLVVLASSSLMLCWTLLIMNIGRRRYPVYWWSPQSTFVREKAMDEEKEAMEAEASAFRLAHIEEGIPPSEEERLAEVEGSELIERKEETGRVRDEEDRGRSRQAVRREL